MQILIWLIIIAAGALSAVQAGSNSTLNKSMHNPALTAIVSNTAGLVLMTMVLIVLWLRQTTFATNLSDLRQVPWWGWIGGCFGGIFVLTMAAFADRIGSGLFTGLNVTAAVITSVLLDHFALAGFKQHPAHLGRVIGCSLMIGGLFLIAKY
jgi:transporter family-2 protein